MKRIILGTLACLCLTGMANAQGLNIDRDWKVNTTASGVDARQGVYCNGKFYIQNRPAGEIEIWDKTGKIGSLPSTTGECGITCDDGGNIIVDNTDMEWPLVTGVTRKLRIYPNAQAPAKDIEIYYFECPAPSTTTAMRSDYYGHVRGNVMSAEGGEICMMLNLRKYINAAVVKNGEVDYDNVKSIEVSACMETTQTGWVDTYINNNFQYSQIPCFNFDGEYCFNKSFVGLKGITFSEDADGNKIGTTANHYSTTRSVWDATIPDGMPADAPFLVGDALFKMGGKLYVCKNIHYKGDGADPVSSFAIYDYAEQELVGIWHANSSKLESSEVGFTTKTARGNWLSVVPTSDTTADIFQYFPADNAGEAWIAKYTFNLNGSGGIAENIADKANVYAANGTIVVDGEAENIAVYTSAGAIVSTGEKEVSVAAGLYIVTVDGTATKVLVK